MVQVLVVDVAHDAEVEAACAQRFEGRDDAFAQPEVACAIAELLGEVEGQVLVGEFTAEFATGLAQGVREEVLVQVVGARQVVAEDARGRSPLRPGECPGVGVEPDPARERDETLDLPPREVGIVEERATEVEEHRAHRDGHAANVDAPPGTGKPPRPGGLQTTDEFGCAPKPPLSGRVRRRATSRPTARPAGRRSATGRARRSGRP